MHHPARLAAILFAGSAALFLFLWLGERRTSSQLALANARHAGETATLKAAVADRGREIEALRAQLRSEGILPSSPGHQPSLPPDESKRLEAVRNLAQAEQRIAALQASLNEVRDRTGLLEAQIEKLQADNRKLESAGAETRDDLASARRIVEATDAELKSKAGRIAQLEASIRAVREAQSAAERQNQSASTLLGEFADLNRRRENTLQSLQRRFRDISDQFRAFALRLDTNRDNPAAAVPDVSRIQSAVQAAEEDFRQLNTLNTQAQRLAQKLGPAGR